MFVKPAVSHSNLRLGRFATHLLCLTYSWLEITFFWASNPGLLPLQSEVVLLALYSMGNVCMGPRMLFAVELNMQNNAYVSVVLAKFHKTSTAGIQH